MGDIEILESLPSLYPLKDFEEEAILNVCNAFDAIKAEIDQYLTLQGFGTAYRQDVLAIVDKHISGKEQK